MKMFLVDEMVGDAPDLGILFDENALFLDIETTGLSARNAGLYLIGVVYRKDGIWRYRQWFADSVRNEQDLLKSFSEFAAGYETLVHFNGTTFDLPFLKVCAKQYHMELGIENKESVDLYSRLRPLKEFLGMTSLKQKAFEERMGILREDKFSGGELIEVYKNYVKKPDDEAKELLLLHNRDDLLGMVKIAELLKFERIFGGSFALKSMDVDEAYERVRLQLSMGDGFKAPVSVTYAWERECDGMDEEADSGKMCPDFELYMTDQNITIDLPEKDGQVKLFFSDYKNYFYLPDEDKAVHKSVGVYVDPHFREKATFETAYQWVSLELLKSSSQQLDVFLHSLFEHYIFDGKIKIK